VRNSEIHRLIFGSWWESRGGGLKKFSKVSALLTLLNKRTVELTLENFYLPTMVFWQLVGEPGQWIGTHMIESCHTHE